MLDQSLHRFGPFLIIRTLGRGGMGEVFVARTPWAHRPLAALKRLRPDVARVPTFAERFQHESELAVRLEHPNVVGTLDVGSVDEQLYVASELVLGKDTGLIADRLRERGQGGPAAVAIRLLMDALAGLSYVHGVREPDGRPLRLLHRDVTPGNLLVGYDGTARLADFGLAKSLLTERSNLTQHGEILGTPHYLAPEVIRGEPASTASDLYGLGAVMYRFLTGVAPHHGTTAEVLMKVLQEEPRPLSELRPDLSPWIVAFIHRLLEKDPSRRPDDAAELGEQLFHDARHAGLVVARQAVGQWLVNLFEVEHSDELDEYERIAEYEPDDAPAKPEGTVVLARPEPTQARLQANKAEVFQDYDDNDGTLLDASEDEVRRIMGGLLDVEGEGEGELPTRAVSFPGGLLSFDDGTKLERDADDTLDPDVLRPEVEPGEEATHWGQPISPATASLAPGRGAAPVLPGFVGARDSYDPEKTPLDDGDDVWGSQTQDQDSDPRRPLRRRHPDSVVVSPVVPGSEPPLARTTLSPGNNPTLPPTRPMPAADRGRSLPVRPDAIGAPPEPAARPVARPPVSEPPPPERARPSRPGVTGPKVRIAYNTAPDGRGRNLTLAAVLLVLAVALGVGIGAMVASVRSRHDPVPAPAVATSASALTKRFLALRQSMDTRTAQGEVLPERVHRLSHDAATALIKNDEAAARLYIEEIERLLGQAPTP